MKDATLVFLVKSEGSKISEICLAEKKRGFAEGKWNGVGGKVELELNETVLEGARRETLEEIGVEFDTAEKVAELRFHFLENSSLSQYVHVFIVRDWDGDPAESEEVAPKWFKVKDIPYDKMWTDDKFWLPQVLNGEKVLGEFIFGPEERIYSMEVNAVDRLEAPSGSRMDFFEESVAGF